MVKSVVKLSGYLVLILAVLLSGFQIWQGVTSTISATYFRPAHLSWVMVLIFLHFPLVSNEQHRLYIPGRLFDLVLAVTALVSGYFIVSFDYNDINYLLYGLGTPNLIAGVVCLALLLEACRRTVGWVMVVIAGLFLAYSAFGSALPGDSGDQSLQFAGADTVSGVFQQWRLWFGVGHSSNHRLYFCSVWRFSGGDRSRQVFYRPGVCYRRQVSGWACQSGSDCFGGVGVNFRFCHCQYGDNGLDHHPYDEKAGL